MPRNILYKLSPSECWSIPGFVVGPPVTRLLDDDRMEEARVNVCDSPEHNIKKGFFNVSKRK